MDGEFESEIQYSERMSGIFAVYVGILQTTEAGNRYGMDHGWIWFSRVLNLKSRKITPVLIHTFLEIAGHSFLQNYQKQGHKIIQSLIRHFIPTIPATAIASKTRLELFLETTYLKTGQFPIHEGKSLEA
jgi:hypothetical protein